MSFPEFEEIPPILGRLKNALEIRMKTFPWKFIQIFFMKLVRGFFGRFNRAPSPKSIMDKIGNGLEVRGKIFLCFPVRSIKIFARIITRTLSIRNFSVKSITVIFRKLIGIISIKSIKTVFFPFFHYFILFLSFFFLQSNVLHLFLRNQSDFSRFIIANRK